MLLSPCGADCNVCEFKEGCGGSCFACKGKPCYITNTGLEICAIYDCAINKKGYKSCAECAELPCNIFYAWKDPSISDEDFKANVDMRVATLKEHDILDIEIAALERWNNGDPSGYISLFTDDINYFDPFQEKRIDGIEAMTNFYESLRGGGGVTKYEIIAPKVTITGDVAVLTYNLNSWLESAKKWYKWNATAVYRKEGGNWKMSHNHWSLVKPLA